MRTLNTMAQPCLMRAMLLVNTIEAVERIAGN
jgi:hypothetical protein